MSALDRQATRQMVDEPLEDDEEAGHTMVASRAELQAALQTQKSSAARPFLIVVSGGAAGKMKPVDGPVVIGRSATADVVLDEDGISRKHARFSPQPDGKVVLEDLGSTNGTFVNGVRIERHVLTDGDKIQIGPVSILKFSYHW